MRGDFLKRKTVKNLKFLLIFVLILSLLIVTVTAAINTDNILKKSDDSGFSIEIFTACAYKEKQRYEMDGKIGEEVLCNYLSRAVTISPEVAPLDPVTTPYIKSFILNTGAKYIQRAATCWNPDINDLLTHKAQKEFITDLHKSDPDVIFEACIFECVSTKVNEIPVPEWVFKDFGLTPEKRNFSFDDMCFSDGLYLNQWGEGSTVPDITKLETRMFFYYRACTYIDLGFEGLHMGQVHLMGSRDNNWANWTELLKMIRVYAAKNARRNYVLINSHTHGIVGSDGVLLFDFHSYPSRPMADGTQEPHKPTEDNPQRASFDPYHCDSIYGKSLGGKTYSGWTTDSLPYLVELDNYGDDESSLNVPYSWDMRCWGMDEITWFANQPQSYRKEFLNYAYTWVKDVSDGKGFLALPGERVARYYNGDGSGNIYSWRYYGYDPQNFYAGNGDESIVKEIFSKN